MTNVFTGITIGGSVVLGKILGHVAGGMGAGELTSVLPVAIPFGCFAWYVSHRFTKIEDAAEANRKEDALRLKRIEDAVNNLDCQQCKEVKQKKARV